MSSFYYNEKGEIFLSKFDAIAKSSVIGLYYYDKEFSRYDWTKEPSNNLNYYYKQRAQQIRDTYEKVIIAYSGGIDSTNVLETFYYNDIKIDEILMVGAFSQDSFKGSDENHNAEIYHNCLKTLSRFNLKNTKIVLDDYSLLLPNKNNFSLADVDDWYRWIGARYPLHAWYWYDAEKRCSNSKKTALVFGIDKPMIDYDFLRKKFFFRFVDGAIFQYGQTPEKLNSQHNYERVNFYWDPNATELLIKQTHVVKKFFIDNVVINKNIKYEYFRKNIEQIISKIIYEVHNPLTVISPKSGSKLFSLRDTFILKKPEFQSLDIFKCFDQGQNIITHKGTSKKQVYDENIYSKKYYLE